MSNENLYIRLIGELNLPFPKSNEEFKDLEALRENPDSLLSIEGPGVYMIEGERDGNPEILYVGTTTKEHTDVGKRVNQQIFKRDNFKTNIEQKGYVHFIDKKPYRSLGNELKTVLIEKVHIFLFNKTKEDFQARDLLEILLIAKHNPYFNKKNAYLTEEERNDQEFEESYKEVTKPKLSEEELRRMQIYDEDNEE
ncbi:TPA: hypothetical protein ACQ444_005102 [Bacillus cereus]